MAASRTLSDRMRREVIAAMERAAIAGLCREGQLEIGAQTVRELEPGVGAEEAFALAKAIEKAMERSRSSRD